MRPRFPDSFRSTRCWRLALAVAGLLLPATLLAQSTPPEPEGREPACAAGRISSIFIDNHSIFDLADPEVNARLLKVYRLVNRLHVPTRASVIRRELTFREGDCYDPAVLAESERIVRAAPFIAGVDIYGIRQPDGTYHVIVDTRDEWSTRIEPQTEPGSGGLELSGVSLREDNVLGTGRQVSVFALKRYDERTFGGTFFTPQLFATRWDAGLAAGRSPVGPFFAEVLAYPFLGEEGRWAARQQIRQDAYFFEYIVPRDSGLVTVLLPEQRQILDVGGVRRFGSRGRLTLVGAALAGEHITYPEGARFADRDQDTLGVPSPASLRDSFRSTSAVRALLLVGQRNVSFVRRRGLDTVHGTEDVRLGVEAEAALGHTIGRLSEIHGPSVELGFFAATEPTPGILTGGQLTLEGKREGEPLAEGSRWNDVFAQLEGWTYWRPTPVSHTTLVAALSAVGGWHTTVPFQLTLGGGSGLRGYPRHLYPGGRRMVASLESRTYVRWPLPELFDLGLVSFVDFGRIWAGDVRFGEDSPYRASVGLGLRTAFPPGSPRTFRLDVGLPIQRGLHVNDFGIRIGIGQAIGPHAIRIDPQLRRSSRRGLSTSLFRFPN